MRISDLSSDVCSADLRGGQGSQGRRGVLVFSNEYTNDELMFRGVTGSADLTDTQLQIVQAAHGMTIVDVRRQRPGTPWEYDRRGRRNQRLHAHTAFALDGPAAGNAALRTSAHRSGRPGLGTLKDRKSVGEGK